MRRIGLGLMAIASAPLAIGCLLIAMGKIGDGSFSAPVAFGMSLVFVMWCYHGYDIWVSKIRKDDETPEYVAKHPVKEMGIAFAPRLFLLGIVIAYIIHSDALGFACACLASVFAGIGCVMDYRNAKQIGQLVFAILFLLLSVAPFVLGMV